MFYHIFLLFLFFLFFLSPIFCLTDFFCAYLRNLRAIIFLPRMPLIFADVFILQFILRLSARFAGLIYLPLMPWILADVFLLTDFFCAYLRDLLRDTSFYCDNFHIL